MREDIVNVLRYERAETLKIARSLPEDIVAKRPGGLAQSPAWIVCHLYLADSLLGGNVGLVPGDMTALFRDVGPDSDIDRAGEALATHFGGWGAAIDAAANSHRALLDAIARLSEADWAATHPSDEAREYFPTIGHNVVYTVWHEGNHGGQLRAWVHAARHEGLLPGG